MRATAAQLNEAAAWLEANKPGDAWGNACHEIAHELRAEALTRGVDQPRCDRLDLAADWLLKNDCDDPSGEACREIAGQLRQAARRRRKNN